MPTVVPIEKLLELKLVKREHFSTGRPFETVWTYFCLRDHWRDGWSYQPQPTSEKTLSNPIFQKSLFRGDWKGYALEAGFVDDGLPLPETSPETA